MQKLTVKQEKFVHGLIKGLSQREAYKRSYNAKNMKDNTIDRKAYETFKKDYVKARFNELNGKVVKKAEEKTIASAIDVLEFYSNVMKGKEKDTALVQNEVGQMEEIKIDPQLKERLKAADALAKKYGLNDYNVKVESNQTILDVSKMNKEDLENILKEE